jgi:acyl-CoA reductase-like NAD-dependent aldehyde dehydrogenase
MAASGYAGSAPAETKVKNPRTGEVDYTFKNATPDEVKGVCDSCREAQKAWAAKTVEERVAVIGKWQDELKKSAGSIIGALSQDTGRMAMCQTEYGALMGFIAQWSRLGPMLIGQEKPEATARTPGMDWISYQNQLVPLGVIANIAPWNYPIILSMLDTIPALVAGCAVVLKPSSMTPRWCKPLFDSVDAIPELSGVFKHVLGPGASLSDALVNNVDGLVLTGSTAVGKTLAKKCGERLIPSFLELGGSDAAVVLKSADAKIAATACLRAAIVSTGQSCMSVERVYVHEAIYDEFMKETMEQANKIRLNNEDINDGHIGPFIDGKQGKKVQEQVEDAVKKGAKLLCGGKLEAHGGGAWMNATVLADCDHTMEVMMEETFGPVMPVMKYKTNEEGIKLANDSVYGLSASVYGSKEEGEEVARQINAGSVCVNDSSLQAYMMEAENEPFGESAFGPSRMGPSGLFRYFRKKAVIFNNKGSTRTINDAGEKGVQTS